MHSIWNAFSFSNVKRIVEETSPVAAISITVMGIALAYLTHRVIQQNEQIEHLKEVCNLLSDLLNKEVRPDPNALHKEI